MRIALWMFLLVLALALPTAPRAAEANFTVKDLGDRVRIESNGQLVTEYNYKMLAVPYFYPVVGPTGANMTRNWPMNKEDKSEETDHPHHTGLWFTHGMVNGVDYWTTGTKRGSILQDKIIKMEGGAVARFSTENHWATKGTSILKDERAYEIHKDDKGVTIDFDITLTALGEPVTFGDTKEGSMAIRLPVTMQVKRKAGDAQGHIVMSNGVRDDKAGEDKTWGKRAEWVDYNGPVEGKGVGVAILDHPANPRHPTWWHVRDYGLFAANPFGQHDFEKKEKGIGDLKIAAGESIRFRYRVVFHPGDEKEAGIADLYKSYAADGAQTGAPEIKTSSAAATSAGQ